MFYLSWIHFIECSLNTSHLCFEGLFLEEAEMKNVLADAFEATGREEKEEPKKRKMSTVEKIRLEHEETKRHLKDHRII